VLGSILLVKCEVRRTTCFQNTFTQLLVPAKSGSRTSSTRVPIRVTTSSSIKTDRGWCLKRQTGLA